MSLIQIDDNLIVDSAEILRAELSNTGPWGRVTVVLRNGDKIIEDRNSTQVSWLWSRLKAVSLCGYGAHSEATA